MAKACRGFPSTPRQEECLAFDELGPSVRKQIVLDLTALYEACLIDLGRNWPEYDFMYPKGDVISKTKRPRRNKTTSGQPEKRASESANPSKRQNEE